ncbi:MAG: DNA methyltransferase [Bryobacteraceae bacterium]
MAGFEVTPEAEVLRSMRAFLKENDMMAYLAMMAVRLLELHRVLKPAGSLYLHCDPSASHYLKILVDSVFGGNNFRNEIIWKRTSGRKGVSQFGRVHDVILFYTKSERSTWNPQSTPQNEDNVRGHDIMKDPDGNSYRVSDFSGAGQGPTRHFGETEIDPPPGRHWMFDQEGVDRLMAEGRIVFSAKGQPRLKTYLEDLPGISIHDVWTDIEPINSAAQERLGYPTQKPLTLLERIISSSSNPGEVVLDPFCGCGTSIHAAQKLKREWVGIDITHLAISLIEKRLKDAFPGVRYEVHGTPKDLEGARDLAMRDKYQFQWWAVSLVNAVPFAGKKKGADTGIDGLIYFKPEGKATEKAIVSVKGGENVNVAMVRDLAHVVDRENAKIGVFITRAIRFNFLSTDIRSDPAPNVPCRLHRQPPASIIVLRAHLPGDTLVSSCSLAAAFFRPPPEPLPPSP